MSEQSTRVVGTRTLRHDAPEKVIGRAKYTADLQAPGMAHGKILRSPHAHARIRSIDTSRAEALPGVYAVVTARDLPPYEGDSFDHRALRDSTFASDKVLHVGHPIAAVAARTLSTAEEALDLIAVDYEVLPAVVNVLDAIKPNAPILHEHLRTSSLGGAEDRPTNIAWRFEHAIGDLTAGFAEADVIVEREFTSLLVHQGYIEPQAALAIWSPDGSLTLHTSTQGSFAVRDTIVDLLKLPMADVRVIPAEVGGAFGGKNTSYIDAAAALLARKAGRPVKTVMTRAEVFLGTGPSSGTVIRIKAGANREGRLTALDAQLYYEAGAYPGSPVGSGASVMTGAYVVPNGHIEGFDIVVNKPRSSSYRAPGGTPANFALEQVVDELAEKLGMDPIEFRLINSLRNGCQNFFGHTVADIGAVEVLEAVRAHPHYNAPLGGPNRGRGVAHAYWGNWGARSSATLTVNPDGTVGLVTGSVDITGTRTSLAMQAAEALGLDYNQVKPSVGDTGNIGYSDVSAGSRTTVATGHAVVRAAEDTIARLCARAAQIWGVPVDSMSYERATRTFSSTSDPDKRITFAELAALLPQTGNVVIGVANVDIQEWGVGYGAHIVDVEVDPETGKVKLLRYTAVQDVGKAIHPPAVEGQLQGGATQGIGWALYEGYVYDANGRLLNPHLLDYKLPTALDLPMIDTVLVEVPYPKHPYGARGVGEVPIV
ncbi:MAG: xanthine dehydrogenase family protein molybdopterin-binding subunit, partial [Anaerolineae bacterium]|nr:xanthine dehydrogenase family protein molybdopterin-binding subunit [Anaerolineae bacterium]